MVLTMKNQTKLYMALLAAGCAKIAEGPNPDFAMSDQASAKVPMWGWTRQVGTKGTDDANGIATDSAGNTYVAGYTEGVLDGSKNAGGWDILLLKYDSDGNKVWARQLGTKDVDAANGVATDGDGNVYVTGATFGGLDGNTAVGAGDLFLLKYDSAGTKLWSRQFGTSGLDNATAVAVDGSGNVYVAGTTEGALEGNLSEGKSDFFLIKYDGTGTRLWTRQFGTAQEESAFGVASDGSGNVFVTGWTKGGLDGNSPAGEYDLFLAKYNGMGTRLWTRQLGTTSQDNALSVATDGTGNSYVTGQTQGALDGNQSAGSVDGFLVKYGSDGTKSWSRQFGTTAADRAFGVATDAAGNVWLAGSTLGALNGNTSAGGEDLFLTQFDSAGSPVRSLQLGTAAPDRAHCVATDGKGRVYVAGHTSGGLADNSNLGVEDIFLSQVTN